MMKKKLTAVFLSAVMAVSLMACGGTETKTDDTSSKTEEGAKEQGGTTIEVWAASATSDEQRKAI